jgi:hypothetical protein
LQIRAGGSGTDKDIRHGDELIAIDGLSIRGQTLRETKKTLSLSHRPIRLRFKRRVADA